MEASSAATAIPAEVQQLADSLGVDVQEVIDSNPALKAAVEAVNAQQGGQSQSAAAQAAVGGVAGAAHVPPPGTSVAEGVDAAPAETNEQRLERELAVSQQELQQTRQHMQTMESGRVVGNSGVAGQGSIPPPSLATIEPGLRWAVRNGLMEAEKIADPLIRDLFKADLGGIV